MLQEGMVFLYFLRASDIPIRWLQLVGSEPDSLGKIIYIYMTVLSRGCTWLVIRSRFITKEYINRVNTILMKLHEIERME